MKKSSPLPNRILYDWDKQVYTDTHLKLPKMSLVLWKRNNGMIVFQDEKNCTWTLHNSIPNGKMSINIPVEYIDELNAVTGCKHRYRVFKNCNLCYAGNLGYKNITFIMFHQTVCEENEYDAYIQSNWSVDKYRYEPEEMEIG